MKKSLLTTTLLLGCVSMTLAQEELNSPIISNPPLIARENTESFQAEMIDFVKRGNQELALMNYARAFTFYEYAYEMLEEVHNGEETDISGSVNQSDNGNGVLFDDDESSYHKAGQIASIMALCQENLGEKKLAGEWYHRAGWQYEMNPEQTSACFQHFLSARCYLDAPDPDFFIALSSILGGLRTVQKTFEMPLPSNPFDYHSHISQVKGFRDNYLRQANFSKICEELILTLKTLSDTFAPDDRGCISHKKGEYLRYIAEITRYKQSFDYFVCPTYFSKALKED